MAAITHPGRPALRGNLIYLPYGAAHESGKGDGQTIHQGGEGRRKGGSWIEEQTNLDPAGLWPMSTSRTKAGFCPKLISRIKGELDPLK